MNQLLPSCLLPHGPESAGFFVRRSRPTDASPARHCPADPPSPSLPGPELSALRGRERRGSLSPPHRKRPSQALSGPLPAGPPSHRRHCLAPGQSPRAQPVWLSGPQTRSRTEHRCGLIWPCHFLAVQPRERHATTLSLSFLICKGGHTDLKRGQGTHSRPSAHPPAETACQESHRLQKTSRESPAAGEDARH